MTTVTLTLLAYALLTWLVVSDPTRIREGRFRATNVLSLLILLGASALFIFSSAIWTSAFVSRPDSPDAGAYVLLYMPVVTFLSALISMAAVLPKAGMYGRRLVRVVVILACASLLLVAYATYLHWRMTRH